jgi:DNA-binding response OmpR family regulator
MRPAVLSISTEKQLAPIRNTVLAHAGYGVIPANSTESALKILQRRHICALLVGNSLTKKEQKELCDQARRMGIPSVVLDPREADRVSGSEVHVHPLDGPEMYLDALATLVASRHESCAMAAK